MIEKCEMLKLYGLIKRSKYDVLQAQMGDRWSTPLSFAPCDPQTAAKSAMMLKAMIKVESPIYRHARRARLRSAKRQTVDAVLITVLPAKEQVTLDLESGEEIHGLPYLNDDVIEAILSSLPKEKQLLL